MTEQTQEHIRYPIGRFEMPDYSKPGTKSELIAQLEQTAYHLRAAVHGLNQEQLRISYREGGWNAQQLVHHLADSYIHLFIRFKWGLTESRPAVRPFQEESWAQTADVLDAEIHSSLEIVSALLYRWSRLLHTISDDQLQREVVHEEAGVQTLGKILAFAVWHGKHHTAHIGLIRSHLGLE